MTYFKLERKFYLLHRDVNLERLLADRVLFARNLLVLVEIFPQIFRQRLASLPLCSLSDSDQRLLLKFIQAVVTPQVISRVNKSLGTTPLTFLAGGAKLF